MRGDELVAVVEAGKGTVVVEVGTGRGFDALTTILWRLESTRDSGGQGCREAGRRADEIASRRENMAVDVCVCVSAGGDGEENRLLTGADVKRQA